MSEPRKTSQDGRDDRPASARPGLMARVKGLVWGLWGVRFQRIRYARSIGVRIGRDCRLLGLTRETFGSEPYLIDIGDHVTICAGVHFVTHDGGVWVFRENEPQIESFAPIEIGSNSFIGVGSIILPGVTIGKDVVVGAGSVVVSDIESGTVAAGAPARSIRSVEEYRDRMHDSVEHIRDWPLQKKREYLIEKFALADRIAKAESVASGKKHE